VHSAPVLVANETRAALADSVRPWVDAVVSRLDAPGQALVLGDPVDVDGKMFACRLGVIVQAHPLMLRVVVHGLPRLVELERIDGAQVPGLRDAVDDIIAGALAGISSDAADAVVLAVSRDCALLVTLDLEDGTVRVLCAKRDADLSEAVVVGAIVNPPGRSH
jgi:hypothetical protein